MRGVSCIAAALFTAALSVSVQPASAGAGQSGAAQPHFMFFTGADLWRNGGFAHAGLLWAPSGLDSNGTVLKLAAGGGLYRYISGTLGDAEVTGRLYSGSILLGWRIRHADLFVTMFGGLDFQNHKLTPDDPDAGLRGGYGGLRTGFELWYQPSATTMLAMDASATTIGPSLWARFAYGWRVFDRFYIGPEIAGLASNGNYSQFRAGVHVTGLKYAMFSRRYLEWLNYEWSGGLGFASDSDRRSSVYIRLGTIMRL
jgi:hypothetical protein